MGPDLLVVLVPLALLIVLLVLQVPVAFALAGSGAVGLVMMDGFGVATRTLANLPYSTTAVYTLTLIPMFILMGLFISHSGMLDDMFDVAHALTRRFSGGLGIASVVACTLFGGVSGSSVADSATLGRLSIGEMAKRGYSKEYAASIVAAAGTLATLIPPSIALVVYGIITTESIGALLLAGIIPGIASASMYIGVIVHRGRRGRRAGHQPADVGGPSVGFLTTFRENAFGVGTGVIVSLIVIGGLYSGVFTATEAGASGAFAAFLLSAAFVVLRSGADGGRWREVRRFTTTALKETGSLTAMIFALLVGAGIFTQFLLLARVPNTVSAWILDLPLPPELVVGLFLIAMIPLGMFVDGLSMLLIVTPLAYPIVVTTLGFNGLWFGILLVKMIEVGLITPPVGLNVYVVSGLFDDLSAGDVFKRVTPFLVTDIVTVALLFVFPALVTIVPRLSRQVL